MRMRMNLETNTEEVTCDNVTNSEHPVSFLRTYIYFEGEPVKVQYQSIRLGAKCMDSDYIAPYIKYCNYRLDIYKSNISYR